MYFLSLEWFLAGQPAIEVDCRQKTTIDAKHSFFTLERGPRVLRQAAKRANDCLA